MSESANQLITFAMQLTAVERAAVADAILASLQPAVAGDSFADVQQAWSQKIRTRVDDIDSGRVNPIPSAEAWKMIDGEAELPD